VRRIATRNIPWEQCLVLPTGTYPAVDGYSGLFRFGLSAIYTDSIMCWTVLVTTTVTFYKVEGYLMYGRPGRTPGGGGCLTVGSPKSHKTET
jgi:hypothetical protein